MKGAIATALLRWMETECNGKCFRMSKVISRLPVQVVHKRFLTKKRI